MQVLENMLPAVSDINRGGSFVQLLVQLAGEYGVSVEIPEVLRPKMKGSTVLAKNLRALESYSRIRPSLRKRRGSTLWSYYKYTQLFLDSNH